MRKYIIIALTLIVLTTISIFYVSHNPQDLTYNTYVKKLVFTDRYNQLVPISMAMNDSSSNMQLIYNKIDIMKSNEFESNGLYPILDQTLEVISLDEKGNNFKLHIYMGEVLNLRTIEALTYIFDDVYDTYELDIIVHDNNTLDSKVVYEINDLRKSLGINNFVDISRYIHNSISLSVYKSENINNDLYYIPIAYRIDTSLDLYEKVYFILNKIDQHIILENVVKENDDLIIELNNSILNDNEKVDLELETKIIMSLSTIDEFENIYIYIDGVNVRNLTETNIAINYFQ